MAAPEIKKEKEAAEEAEVLGVEKPAEMVAAVGVGIPIGMDGKPSKSVVITFYFSPPEPEKHVHVVLGRYALEWDEAESFAEDLLKTIKEVKSKQGK